MKLAIVKRGLMIAAAMLVLPFIAQTAHADTYVDFSCSTTCTGTVSHVASTYSTSGIGGLIQSAAGGPDFNTGLFTLIFNTSTNAISMTGNAAANNDTLLGSIVGVNTATPNLLALTVNWTSLPTTFQNYLHSATGNGVGSVIYLATSGQANSVDFQITPTPEPGSVIMLGTGLLGLCGMIRRKAFNS